MKNRTGFPLVGAHDERLANHVHPEGWANPTPTGRYNLVVLGGGTAGLVAAAGAAGLGAKVALVERHALGGDCLNVGCVPSKGLIRAGRAAAEARDAKRFGVQTGEVRPDLLAALERMRRLRADIAPHDSAARFRDLGVDVFLGAGRFTAARSLEVAGTTLQFRKALIATGARARVPDIPGLDQVPHHTNATIFSLTQVPERLLVVGGGPIGVELAQAFARLGVAVTLLDRGERILGPQHPDAARIVAETLRRDGVEIHTGASELAFPRDDAGPRFTVRTEKGSQEGPVDQVLLATGRTPNVEGLGLEAAGVAFHATRGVQVDRTLRTTNKHIFASGDVAGRHAFTHTADAESRVVLRNALFPFLWRQRASLVVPRVTYADPEVASVGLGRVQADRDGVAFEAIRVELPTMDRARLDGAGEGFLEVLLKPGSDRILGATLVSPHAGETLSQLTTAMVHGIGLRKLSSVIHPYPTQAEIVKRAADEANRQRLTPFKAKLLAWVMARLR